ncbi:TatD family hydrolase [Niameybacter massiliensis]|uniref:TatD family hydrolase n=1 Tax=Holtiella tumoricola TaxID=3018743 RepID=A0AA42J0C8_9FIRM|nr:TatD family hydrolase [Holtiella tumoricola]MDA3730953.1 TatD family hydrolase [Holtiella tumoricola]
MYFDSHAHYNDERFDEDRDMLLNRIHQEGVEFIINIGADMPSSRESISLAETYPFIYATVGVHPHDVSTMTMNDIETLEEMARHPKVVGIGEIGLDYYYNHSSEEEQVKWFKAQLELAKKLDLPVSIHSRDASQLTFDIIKDSGIKEGVIHCFSGSQELAVEYVKRGFYIGIGGSLTFKNARKTVEVVERIPLESILIETDCPYLTPVPHRGKRNDSSYLPFVMQKIAEIKGITEEEVARITLENTKKLFKI